MSDLPTAAVQIAAKATGLRPDQVERVVAEYRSAANALEHEPEWRTLTCFDGPGWGLVQAVADGTRVSMQVESEEIRGQWKSETVYVFEGRRFELYAEARAVELAATVGPRPYGLPT